MGWNQNASESSSFAGLAQNANDENCETHGVQVNAQAAEIQGDELMVNSTSRALFSVHNLAEMREEIEIEIGNSNGTQLTGTITMVEAKHGIYDQIPISWLEGGYESFKVKCKKVFLQM